MRMVTFAIAIAVVMLIAGTSTAEPLRIGVGIGANDAQGTIYFPIEKGSYIVEPMLYASWRDYNKNGVTEEVSTMGLPEVLTGTIDESYDSNTYKAGVGFFRTIKLVKKLRMLVGIRVGYQYMKNESGRTLKDTSGMQYSSTQKEELDGAFIEPVLALEYALTDNISLGGTVFVSYAKLTGSSDETRISMYEDGRTSVIRENSDATNTTSSTETALYLKYIF